MARYNWFIVYDGVVNVLNAQNIVITKGRTQVTDAFKASTATITGRDVNALPNIEIGKDIEIIAEEGTDSFSLFYGVVADIKITYGQVASMDSYEIHCEDALAAAGRSFTTDSFSWSAGITPYTAGKNTMDDAFGGSVVLAGGPFSISTVSAQSVPNANVLQLLNQLAATEQGYLTSLQPDAIKWINRQEYITQPVIGDFIDDTGVSLNPIAYFNEIIFRSQADSFFEKVVVEPAGLAPQSSGTGSRVFTVKTFDQTTTQAQNLADYTLATLLVQDSVPSTVSAISEIQPNNILMTAVQRTGQGFRMGIVFRNNSYSVFLEGCTVTATPEQTRWTFNVVSSEALSFFILDNSAFGKLDQNRLGF
jgi:hypothetical protein